MIAMSTLAVCVVVVWVLVVLTVAGMCRMAARGDGRDV